MTDYRVALLDPAAIGSEVLRFWSDHAPTLFQAPTWCLTWWEQVARPRGYQSVFMGLFRGDTLLGVVPFVRTNRRTGIGHAVEFAGSDVSFYQQPICAAADSASVMGAAIDFVARRYPLDTIDLYPLSCAPVDGGQYVETAPVTTTLTTVLPASPRALGDVIGRYAKDVAYYRRRCERELDVVLADHQQITNALWSSFVHLHTERVASKGHSTAIGEETPIGRFYRMVADTAAQDGRLHLSSAYLADGTAAGMLLIVDWNGTAYYLNGGFNPSFAKYNIGSVLIADAMTRAVERGCTAFDFLGPDQPYKRRWGTQPHSQLRVVYHHSLATYWAYRTISTAHKVASTALARLNRRRGG